MTTNEKGISTAAVRDVFAFLEARQQRTQSELLDCPLSGADDQERLRALEERFLALLERLSDDFYAAWEMTTPRKGERLYFWPGFQSRLFGRLRLAPPSEIRMTLGNLGYEGSEYFATGKAYPSSETRIERTALYFDALLSGPTYAGRSRLLPGGTHNWLTELPKPRLKGLASEETTDLEVLEIGLASTQCVELVDPGWIRITLDRARPVHRGVDLGRILNDARYIQRSQRLPWPLPFRDSGESDQDFIERVGGTSKEATIADLEAAKLREDLYTLWLAACFESAEDLRRILQDDFTTQLRARLGLVAPKLEARITWLCNVEFQKRAVDYFESSRYSWWTSLVLPESLSVTFDRPLAAEDRELGSAMFLSSSRIAPAFVVAARQWVFSFYLTLRHLENTFTFGRQRAAEAATQQQRLLRAQQAHAIGTEFVYIASRAKSVRNNLDHLSLTVRRDVISSLLRTHCRDPEYFHDQWSRHGAGTSLTPLSSLEERVLRCVLERQTDSAGCTSLPIDVALSLFELLDTSYMTRAIRATQSLESETRKATMQNLALLRIDEGTLTVTPASPVAIAQRFDALLARSLLVAMTTFFDRALPPGGERGEVTYLASFGSLVPGDGLRLVLSWQDLLDRTRGDDPSLKELLDWIASDLRRYSLIRIGIHLPSDAESGVEINAVERTDTALALMQACLQEMLLNALKYVRPRDGAAELEVFCGTTTGALILVQNTIDATFNAQALKTGIDGHFGVGFLRYAAEKLLGPNSFSAERDSENHVSVRFGRTERSG